MIDFDRFVTHVSLDNSKTVKTIHLENVDSMNLYQETKIQFCKDRQSIAICLPDCEWDK